MRDSASELLETGQPAPANLSGNRNVPPGR